MRYLKCKPASSAAAPLREPLKVSIGIIGLGNMGCALLKGLVSSGPATGGKLRGFDIEPTRRRRARRLFGVSLTESIGALKRRSDVVIIAVKPKDVAPVLEELSAAEGDVTYLSIAAGIKTRDIEEKIGGRARVIRVMPNTPALVGEGMSAICGGRHATERDLGIARAIFSSVGDCAEIKENYFDLVTAVSGSGPAYFLYLAQALIEAGEGMGLGRALLKRLVAKTALGSAKLLVGSSESPEALRQRVTSKGGTTEAAIRVFEKNKLKRIIAKAVCAALRRSKEMSALCRPR